MRIPLFVTVCALLVVPGVRADASYSYVGQPFSFCYGSLLHNERGFCTVDYHLVGHFTTTLDQSQLENLTDFAIPSSDISFFGFRVSGTSFVSNSDNGYGEFQISTDSSGHIAFPSEGKFAWSFSASGPSVFLGSGGYSHLLAGDDALTSTGDGGQTNETVHGAWTDNLPDVSSDPAPVPTPEPGTLALFGSGLLALVAIRRRRNSHSAEVTYPI